MDTSSDNLQVARAKRVKGIRNALGLTRKEFDKRFGIALGTLQHWENPKSVTGLTEKGAMKLANTLKTERIFVNSEWLMFGTGEAPNITTTSPHTFNVEEDKIDSKAQIKIELAFFCDHHKESIHTIVEDDAMEPIYKKGDYVAGIRHYNKQISKLLNKDCIILTKDGKKLIRRLDKGNIPGCYHLKSININARVERPILYDEELVFAAPIIWIRRS